MNKTELVEFIATQADISKAKAGAAVDAFVEAVTASLKKGKDVVKDSRGGKSLFGMFLQPLFHP